MKKGKTGLLIGIGTAVILIAGVTAGAYQASEKTEEETAYKEVTVEKGTLTVGVTESGSVTVGTLTQELEPEGNESTTGSDTQAGMASGGNTVSGSGSTTEALEVEVVYVSVGQTVAVGEPLLKLSEESIREYRETLEETVQEAKLSLSEADLNAQKQKLEAGYSYNSSVAQGSVAEETYQATLKELQEVVDSAQEAVDESASLLTYFQEQINAGVDLSESLAEEQINYEKLYTRLKAAQNAYTTKSIEAQETYQKAMFSSSNASSQYEVDLAGADSGVEAAEEALSEAQEALEEFDSCIGADGVIYAEYAGVIVEIGCEAGDTLSSDTGLVTFADTEAVTMTVSVSEEDIALIALGDVVNITLNAYGDTVFSGEVQSMNTSSSSGSSTVSYEVTVAFTGDVTGIYTDMTGTVTFIQEQVEDVLYVSNKAVIKEETASYVKVKESDGTTRTVEVTTGFSDGVNVEIVSGLSEGETVLIESQVKLQ